MSFVRQGTPWTPASGLFSFTLTFPGGSGGEPEETGGSVIYRGVPARNDYELIFDSWGYATQRIRSIVVQAGATTTVAVQYDPADPTGVEGTLRMPDGSPVRDTLISARPEGTPNEVAGTDKTDANGRFAIVGLRPGVYVLDAMTLPRLGRATIRQGVRTSVELVWGNQVSIQSGVAKLREVAALFLQVTHLTVNTPTLMLQEPPSPPGSLNDKRQPTAILSTRHANGILGGNASEQQGSYGAENRHVSGYSGSSGSRMSGF